jgi:hypothetical protein
MIKKLSIFLIFVLGFSACKEDDLTINNPVLPRENVRLTSSFIYHDASFSYDSLFIDGAGNQFYIDELKVMVGNFYLVQSTGDTIFADKRLTMTPEDADKLAMRLTPGGYTAYAGASIGLDSAGAADAILSSPDADDPINDPDFKRTPNSGAPGFNHLVIKGRILDPSNPDDSIGTIPFSYQVGTEELVRSRRSDVFNFAVSGDRVARFILQVDIGGALSNRDVLSRPVIISDPTNSADFTAATEIMNNTVFFVF